MLNVQIFSVQKLHLFEDVFFCLYTFDCQNLIVFLLLGQEVTLQFSYYELLTGQFTLLTVKV